MKRIHLGKSWISGRKSSASAIPQGREVDRSGQGAFVKALSDDWKATKAIEPLRRAKPAQPAPEPVEELSDELLAMRGKEMASLKAKFKGVT
jgi:hypothetical protein